MVLIKRDHKHTHTHKHRIVHYQEAHPWTIDNEYLLTGHRVDFDRFGPTFRSLCMKHNETVNIWIHLIGVVMFLFFLVLVINKYSHSANILKQIKTEFEDSPIAKKFAEITRDLLALVSSEAQAFKEHYAEFVEKVKKLREQNGQYFG